MKFIKLNYWKSIFYKVPLSQAVKQKIAAMFSELDRPKAAKLIRVRCGTSLPMMDTVEIDAFDRIRLAVIQRSGGSLVELERLIDEANVDWREVVKEADGQDVRGDQHSG